MFLFFKFSLDYCKTLNSFSLSLKSNITKRNNFKGIPGDTKSFELADHYLYLSSYISPIYLYYLSIYHRSIYIIYLYIIDLSILSIDISLIYLYENYLSINHRSIYIIYLYIIDLSILSISIYIIYQSNYLSISSINQSIYLSSYPPTYIYVTPPPLPPSKTQTPAREPHLKKKPRRHQVFGVSTENVVWLRGGVASLES